MPRFKLANGGVIASCKQPLQKRDFDRIVISDNYNDSFEGETFDTLGGPPDTGDITFYVTIYNPSTHLIRKCHNVNNCYMYMSFGPKFLGYHAHRPRNSYVNKITVGKTTNRQYHGKIFPLDFDSVSIGPFDDIDYGSIIELEFMPHIYPVNDPAQLVNPFNKKWYNNYQDIRRSNPNFNPNLEAYQNYINDYYTQKYEFRIVSQIMNGKAKRLRSRGNIRFRMNRRCLASKEYNIVFKIH